MPTDPNDQTADQKKLFRQAKRTLYGAAFLSLICASYFIAKPIFDDIHDNKDDIEKIEMPIREKPLPQEKPSEKTDTIFPPKPILV